MVEQPRILLAILHCLVYLRHRSMGGRNHPQLRLLGKAQAKRTRSMGYRRNGKEERGRTKEQE